MMTDIARCGECGAPICPYCSYTHMITGKLRAVHLRIYHQGTTVRMRCAVHGTIVTNENKYPIATMGRKVEDFAETP